MSERRRLRRRDPERTVPRRFSEQSDEPNSFFPRASEEPSPQPPYSAPGNSRHQADEDFDPWNFGTNGSRYHAEEAPWQRTREPLDDPVTAGVRMGYKVIEEHIRQGQRVARQIADRDYRSGDFSDDVWEIFHRAIRYSEDLAAQGFELLLSLSRLGPNGFPRDQNSGQHPRGNPWSRARPESRFSDRDDRRPYPFDSEENRRPYPFDSEENRRPYPFEAEESRRPHPFEAEENRRRHPFEAEERRTAGAETGFAIELVAEIPVAVHFDLAPGAGHDLEVAELRCSESDATLSQAVSWAVAGPTRKLRVHVDPDQPAGTYVGPLIDLYGHERGWLTVHVGEIDRETGDSLRNNDEGDVTTTESPFEAD